LPNGIDYRGSLEDWPAVFRQILEDKHITDVALFGDCRDYHLPAIRICHELGVPVHVFEEGYIRPDWVTLELGGVNGHSSLPRDAAWYRQRAATLAPAPRHAQVHSSFRRRAFEAIAYNAAVIFMRWYYPGWRSHRPWPPLVEGAGWWRKLCQRKQRARSSAQLMARLEASAAPYFLFPLQLDSDAQIRSHSPFAGIADALKLVIGSFAAHAPEDARLLVKEHPLDNGVRDWQQETADMAALFGVATRVDYLAAGDIVPVARNSRGVVTINSTSGTLALAEGVPVIVLGEAIYNMPDITHQGELDDFWCNPMAPDVLTFNAFVRVLIERCLIPGGFYSEAGIEKVVRHAVARIEGWSLVSE
jgi:capsular polysaccharide export protein